MVARRWDRGTAVGAEQGAGAEAAAAAERMSPVEQLKWSGLEWRGAHAASVPVSAVFVRGQGARVVVPRATLAVVLTLFSWC